MQNCYITTTSRLYSTIYGTTAPYRNSILRCHRILLENGIVADLLKLGRPRISPQIVVIIEAAFHDHDLLSLRVTERDLRVPGSTICEFLKKKLKMLPYKLCFLSEQFPREYSEKLKWAQYCRTELEFSPNY